MTADERSIADGDGTVLTIYGQAPRDTFPMNVTRCLTGIDVRDDASVFVVDAGHGYMLELSRHAMP